MIPQSHVDAFREAHRKAMDAYPRTPNGRKRAGAESAAVRAGLEAVKALGRKAKS